MNARVGMGRYELGEVLGSGGMATVYRARDDVSGREVALKQLDPHRSNARRGLVEALFTREYHTLARLSHASIVEVYDYGRSAAGPYYTMELLEAQDLKQLAPIPYVTACRYLRDVASSLALLHAHRLVHRDVSPKNIRITGEGRAKLIDFGAVASFGPNTEVIGTVPCMAPEILGCVPLSGQTDLYSLGAVAYFVLTGRHAYDVRYTSELHSAWSTRPKRPSAYAAEIPPALDALVLSLLSVDPGARPQGAAELIEQLTAIAALEPDALEHTAYSYLRSSPMVGREPQSQWLRKCLRRAQAGRGRFVMLDGEAGIGKTRLLDELCLEVQISTATLVRADAQSEPAPFGVALALFSNLLRTRPSLARGAAGPHIALLGHLMPDLHKQLGSPPLSQLADDPAERRARFQQGLHQCFVQIARETTLVIAVDDLHWIDDNSAAVLATLAGEAQGNTLLIVCAQRSEGSESAPMPMRTLRRRSARLRLRSLDRTSCEALVDALFGHAANSERLAGLLFEKSAGNPRRCLDLAQLLVERGIARYAGGSWVLPLDVSSDELPDQGEDLLSRRLFGLSPTTRTLAEALSVSKGRVPLQSVLQLAAAEGLSEAETHRALDELLEHLILRTDARSYLFDQDSVREAVYGAMPEAERRKRHLQVAELLLTDGDPDDAQLLEVGWHLVLAGEEERGADTLVGAIHEGLARKLEPESYDRIAEALLAALAVCDKYDRDKHEIAKVLFPLLSVGFLVDWRIGTRYGERAIEVGLAITGLGLASRLRRVLGRPAALLVGLTAGALGCLLHGGKHHRSLLGAIRDFCAIVPPTLAAWTMRYDVNGAARLIDLLTPLRLFGERQVTTLMHDYGIMQLQVVQGNDREARALAASLLARMEQLGVKRLFGDLHWRLLKGGILFARGILCLFEYEDGERAIADELDALDVRLWAMGADQLRLLRHAHRGESALVEHYLARVESVAVQGSATWQAELYWPFLLLPCYIEAHDLAGAHRCVVQLERRAREMESMQLFAEVGRGAYLTLRGNASSGLTFFEQHTEQLAPGGQPAWPVMRMWFAQALVADGQYERARQLLHETVEALGPRETCLLRHRIQALRLIAVADSAMGNHEQAAGLLDQLIEEHGCADQPLVSGLLHKARAEVALQQNDRPAFERHAARVGECFRATDNPSLVAQWTRLLAGGGSVPPEEPSAQALDGDSDTLDSGELPEPLTEISHSSQRVTEAVQAIVERLSAKGLFAYGVAGDRVQLVAAAGSTGASREIRQAVLTHVGRARLGLVSPDTDEDEEEQLTVIERVAERMHGNARSKPPGATASRTRRHQSNSATDTNMTLHVRTLALAEDMGEHALAIVTRRAHKEAAIVGAIVVEAPGVDMTGTAPEELMPLARLLNSRKGLPT